jgi:hypothetical protein
LRFLLAPCGKLLYAEWVGGGFPPHPLSVAPLAVQIPAPKGKRMTRRNAWAGLVLALGLSLSLFACKDTKTLQENEQLKTQIADLQKQNGQMGNDLETVTAARDALAKENAALEAKLKPKKAARKPAKKSTRKKHR